MIGDIGFTLICMAYLFGGIVMGYYICSWKNKQKRGKGRWD
jgi:glycerol-3-phosphate acyltransferase PlsY